MSLEGVLEGGEGAQLGADPVGVPRVVGGVLGHQPGVALVAVYGAAQAVRDGGCVRQRGASGVLGAGDWLRERPYGVCVPV
ncbi:hypothetical protein A9G02_12150 [Cutibacterium avidum]|nr:hypothetical protein A9G02_12150 [Cutibacterium avidum]